MKRFRDDIYASGSQFKRPLGSSRGESYGQSPIPGNSGTGGSIDDGITNNKKLTTDDALTYLKEVKEMFQDQRDKYDMFLEVMKDFKAQRTDTSGVIARVKELFMGHNNLIFGFNTFLPKGFEITLDEVEAPPKKTVEFEEAISFVNKIKKRFQHDEHIYKSFLDILNMYRKDNKVITEVYNEVSTLFEDHLDLLEDFTRFLPDSLAPHTAAQLLRSQAQRYGDHRSGPPLVHKKLMEKDLRRERAVASWGDCDHSVDHLKLNDDKAMIKLQREQRKHVNKDSRERRSRDLNDGEAELVNLQNYPEKRKSFRRADGFEAYSGPPLHSDKYNLKSMYNQAFVFCEKVKETLCSQDDYKSFLKCLNIFSNGIIERKDLQNLVSDLLGKFPDLMDEFNQFFERCESIDGFQHLAGIMSKNSLSCEEPLSRSMKGEEKEREHKHDFEATKEKERSKDKYMEKSIQELDLSDCDRCTPSYRLLPSDYPIPSVQHRQKSGAAVLNDHWVSVTSGSEDYSFKHMRRNQYEESLFRCEDDRFELDMLLESVGAAARSAEELLNIIIEKKISFEGSFRIEDHFTALNLRCIERLYGDHGLDVTDLIRKNPAATLPVILTRLKQKQVEWTKCREGFNVVWADVYAKNHYKSLDHRSFYFKQHDSKNLSAKELVSEIKELKEKSQKEDDVVLSVSVGYRRPVIPHLEYEYVDRTIHEDLFKLVEFSCEEICSTKEQIGKVLRLWANFLELMLGVPLRSKGSDSVENVETKHHSAFTSESGDANVSSDAIDLVSRQLKLAAIGDDHASSGISKHCATDLLNRDPSGKQNCKNVDPASKDMSTLSAVKLRENQKIGNGADKRSGDVDERVATSSAPFRSGVENNNGKIGSYDSSGSHGNISKPTDAIENVDTIQPTQGDDIGRTTDSANGLQSNVIKGTSNNDEAGCPSKIDEEGELSPIGDSEDNFVVYEDRGLKATVKPEHSNEAEGENDDDAYDEDGDDALEASEDASRTESVGDECSQDDNGVEEEGEHDEIDGKAESEGEAEGMESHLIEEDNGLLPLSERVLLSVKPLSKHVAVTALRDEKKKDSRIFYGNDDFYILFRLHRILYDRILSAKNYCTSGEVKRRNSKDTSSPDPYARFMSALFSLLNGSAENFKFEDECRAIIGNQSYVLFTLEKLIYMLVKQLQAVVADDMDKKLLQLYEYEKSRKHGMLIDSVYYENARIFLHEENIYRLECSSSPPRLQIQLMNNITEKPEAYAVSMDPTFASYLQHEFLTNASRKKERQDIMLQRNMRGYAVLDELAVACKAMEGVEVINGLECKMSCSTYKISYVLDTQDFFHRKKKKQKKSKTLSQGRIKRFHNCLLPSR